MAGIPAGFTLDNWDPNMMPMLLMGSAYDAQSLGKWIFDWTVARYDANSPMADIAGHLWLLMLKLDSKTTRVRACLPDVRSRREAAPLRKCLKEAEHIWERFDELVRVCEQPMLDQIRERSGKKEVDARAGLLFVRMMFGRDQELEFTEEVRTRMHHWDEQFEDECAGILGRYLPR